MEATLYDILPIWVVLFPMFMSVIVMMTGTYSEKLRDWLSVATCVITFLSVVAMYPFIMGGEVITYTIFEIIRGLGVTVRVDILSFSLALISSFVWMLVSIYSVGYMYHEHGRDRYYLIFNFVLGSTLGIFMAGDFFTLFIFFELMSLISYVLVIHEESAEALRAGYKYLIITIIGGLALFFGIIITFELAGTVSFGTETLINVHGTMAFLAFLSFLIGFGMKAGMFPLHIWLPDAHPVAPSPASALLSGIMLKTGAYGLLRVLYNVFNIPFVQEAYWDTALLVLAVITILLGSAVALTQEDLKRRLAYSSVGQMGYIILGMALFTEKALVGDVFHIFSHALMKSTLFLAAGAIIWKTGLRNITELHGVGKKMPITMGAFTIAALAMIGIPPLNGFLSKWTLSLGALDAGAPFYVFILLVSSLLNGLYYMPIIISAFFGGEEESLNIDTNYDESPFTMYFPVAVLGLSCLVFGLMPGNIAFELSMRAAAFLFQSGLP